LCGRYAEIGKTKDVLAATQLSEKKKPLFGIPDK
jgi:hypothetical protein